MRCALLGCGLALLAACASAQAQSSAGAPAGPVVRADGWRAVDGRVEATSATAPAESAGSAGAAVLPAPIATVAPPATSAAPVSAAAAPSSPVSPAPVAPAPKSPAKVVEGPAVLPQNYGQVWREYDISPYTLRVTATRRPEQAIVDWVLRETGYEAWHGEPLGVLSATNRSLRVYHTPEVQRSVADIVDRFVNSQAEPQTFSLRVITVDQPNWRTRMQRVLKPVVSQTPGAQAWLLEREDAALLLSDLRRRSDYREQGSPHLVVNNGQSTVVSTMRGRSFVRSVTLRPDVAQGFDAHGAQVDEGFTLEFSPLLSLDGRTIDALVKCDIDQIEKMIPLPLDAPTAANPRQSTQIEVPQIARCRFQERYRWPVEQVLLVGLGMVPLPVPPDANRAILAGLPLVGNSGPARCDLLVMIESKGDLSRAAQTPVSPNRDAKTYHGRY